MTVIAEQALRCTLVGRINRRRRHFQPDHQSGMRNLGTRAGKRCLRGRDRCRTLYPGDHLRQDQQRAAHLLPKSARSRRQGSERGVGVGQLQLRSLRPERYDRDSRKRRGGIRHLLGRAKRCHTAALSAIREALRDNAAFHCRYMITPLI